MGLKDNAIIKRYLKVDEKSSGSTGMGIMVGLFAAIGGILFGYDTGTISGILAMNYVLERFPSGSTPGEPQPFTSNEKSLIVSILSVGTFFGALGAPLLIDSLGRRWTIIIATLIVFNLGIILQTAAVDIPLLCAGRAVAGLGVGLISSVTPTYISETSPKWIRGAIVSSYQWAITIGLLLAACVNQATHSRNDSGSYRIPIAVQFLWSLILGGGMFFLPETPRFYVSKGKEDQAKNSLSRLRKLPTDHPDLIEEYEDMNAAFEFEKSLGGSAWGKLISPQNQQRKRLITGVVIQAFQQLTGVNFIFYYGTTFFKDSGIKNEFLISLATNIVHVGMTFVGVLLIDFVGRRKILLGGSIVMASSQLIIAIVGVASNSDAAQKLLVALSCIFIAGFGATWGPACWAVCGEIYPLITRAKAVSASASSNWIWNWGIAFATPYMVDSGPGNANLGSKVFFIWGGFNVFGGIFTYFMVYETKGLTLEQVDELYEKVPLAWRSSGFEPSTHAFRSKGNLTTTISHEKSHEVFVA